MRLGATTLVTLALLAAGLGWLAVAEPPPLLVAYLVGAGAATLLHEVGHVLGAVAVGVEVDELRVTPISGSVRYAGDPDAHQRAAVSIAGPAASAVGVLVLTLAPWLDGTPAAVAAGLGGFSLVLCVGNLLPLPGSDGLELFRGLRDRRLGDRAGASPQDGSDAEERVDADGEAVG